jgi:hypothetical protein
MSLAARSRTEPPGRSTGRKMRSMRAATALRECRSNDTFTLARIVLEAALRCESDLIDLLPSDAAAMSALTLPTNGRRRRDWLCPLSATSRLMHCNKKHRYSINQIWSGMLYGSKRADEFASLHSITIAYEHVWLTCTKRIRMPQGSLHF